MEQKFKALWVDSPDSEPNNFKKSYNTIRETSLEELSSGDVIIRAHYSGLNYKDALAITGRGKILRHLPLIPGIDVSGEVTQSQSSLFKPGDLVVINGCNLGEKLCGGLSEYLRVPADILMPLPEGLSCKEAMIFGTAGFTAALAIHQLELNGLRPEKGEVLVTGASGGVGSLALSFLNQLGYETEAWTRREQQKDWLEACGASKVTIISEKNFETKPLESVVWSGAIDNLGGKALSYILPRIDLWGSVASIGLASAAELQTSVFPFILRGANLLGISSNNCSFSLRQELWQKMASSMKPKNLDHILSKTIKLEEVATEAENIINSSHHGRIVVDLR